MVLINHVLVLLLIIDSSCNQN